MKDVIFYTIVSDNWFEPVGTQKLINSLKYFHPEVPLKVFRENEIRKVWGENKWINWDNQKATFGKELAKEYKLVVNIDADNMITGKLDEILNEKYDLGSALNNNDFDPKISYMYTDSDHYVNAGLVASRKEDFWTKWEELNKINPNTPFKEQDNLNQLFWSGKYFSKVFDWPGSNLYYSTSARGQWNKMYIENDKLMLNGKEVKIFHEAGGHYLPKLAYKANTSPFKEEVKDYFDKIIT